MKPLFTLSKLLLALTIVLLTSLSANAQKIPFQGKLLENGEPVDGQKTLVFSIDDPSWTETHTDVQITDGLYSVVLGSITDLPAGLFDGVESLSLNVSVDGTALSPVEIYAPVNTRIDRLDYFTNVNGDNNLGLRIDQNVGADFTDVTYGSFITADGDPGNGNGDIVGLRASSFSDNRLYNTGLWGTAFGNGNDTPGSENYGVYGDARNNRTNNYGVYGTATGGLKSYGVYGSATGGSEENWAGYFVGDVKITGQLDVEGGVPGSFVVDQDLASGETANALSGIISGTGNTDNPASQHDGIYGETSASGSLTAGVRGVAKRNTIGDFFSVGVIGEVEPNASGSNEDGFSYGLRGEIKLGDHGPNANAVRGITNNTNANSGGVFGNTGGMFSASNNPNINIGVVGEGRQGSETSESYGVWGSATRSLSARNVGVYGEASGASQENWAGYFDGNTRVIGDLIVDGNLGGSFSVNLNGASMSDPNTLSGQNLGEFFVGNDANGNDPGGASGAIQLYGTNTLNSRLMGQFWENADRPVFDLFGSHTDGNGWYWPNAVLDVQGDATNDWGSLRLYKSAEGENNHQEMIRLEAEGGSGYFAGDLNVDGDINGNINLSSEAYALSEKDWENGTQGYLNLHGDNDPNTTQDSRRVALEVNGEGLANTTGSLNLFGPIYDDPNCTDCPRSFVSMNVQRDAGGNDPNGWNGYLELNGTTSPNVFIGARSYDSHDIPQIQLYGSKPDGNGWFYEQANFSTNLDGTQEWGSLVLRGNDGDHNIELGAKSWEDGSIGARRPFLNMQGSINDDNLVWMEVYDTGDGNEAGGINFTSTDGAGFGINAYGFTGIVNNVDAKGYSLISNRFDIPDGGGGTYKPTLGRLEVHEWGDDTNTPEIEPEQDVAHINLEAIDANGDVISSFGMNAYGLTGTAENIESHNFTIYGNQEVPDGGGGSYLPALAAMGFNEGVTNGNAGWLALRNSDNGNAEVVTIYMDGDNGSASFAGNINVGDYLNANSNLEGGGANTNNGGNINLGGLSESTGIRMYGEFVDGDLNSVSHLALDGTSGNYVHLWGNGGIGATGDINTTANMNATAFNTTSDKRLKTNILPLNNALSNVMKMRGVSYNWIDKSRSEQLQIGVIAQEVEEVYPEFVHTNEEGMKSVNYSQMVAVLIEAIKELNTKISTLETENASLKASLAEVDGLKSQMKNLETLVAKLVQNDAVTTTTQQQ